MTKNNYWMLRDVDLKTRARIKAFAIRNGLTIAEALKEIARRAKI
jgi:hypothetical protein